MESLAAGVAIDALGNGRQCHILDAQIGEHLLCNLEVSRATVDQRRSGHAVVPCSCMARRNRRVRTSRIMP